jgi:hypothetical protein
VPHEPTVTIDQIDLADDPGRWEALGFAVSDGAVQLGTVRLALVGSDGGRGILRWSLRGLTDTALDGLPTAASERPEHPSAPEHPNGVLAIDHLVAMSPDLDRSVDALRQAGLDLRRIREEPTPAGAPRQAFFRLGQTILEVVQQPDDVLGRANRASRPTRFWGLALSSEDLQRTVERLGEHAGEIRPAIQPGRQIATLRRSAGLAVPVALMSGAVA